jgi:branched-chain amino acid transport system ATP-binding protein
MSAAFLSVRDLRAYYGQTQVLFGLDFDMTQGGITTLLGANGAGKTSTLRSLSRMLRTAGEIHFEGKEISGKATEDVARLGIAHVPEGRGTFVRLTVEENLQLGAITRNDRHSIAEDIERIFNYFPKLRERYHQQAGTLSGGEQQMLAIGRALMLRPKLMLLDEPSFGLAPLIVQELFEILRTLNQKEKVRSLALDLADHAYLLETGRVVMAGPARDIREDEGIRRSYLGY